MAALRLLLLTVVLTVAEVEAVKDV